MEIIVLDGHAENPGDLSWEGFESLGKLTVYPRTSNGDPGEAIGRIGGAEAVITNKTLVTREILDACPSVKYIGLLSTGCNAVDLDAAREKGIPVTNIPGYSTDAVGQLTIALLLEICHHAGSHSDAVRGGRWEKSPDFCFWDYPLIELAGKTLGVLGFGNIGRAVGRIAKALGMRVIAYNPSQNEQGREIGEYVTLERLYRESDVISLHCPLTSATAGMINKDSIAGMKDGVILLNTARGPLIQEQDLADALNTGKVYAAGVDVLSVEPAAGENPLLSAKNCVITPHIAWAAKETRQRLMDIAVGNLKGFMEGKPVNTVC